MGLANRQRNRVLSELASEKKLAFMRSFIGKQIDAITLRAHTNAYQGISANAHTEALTDNYLKLRLEGCHEPNRWMPAEVEGVVDGALIGRALVPQAQQ